MIDNSKKYSFTLPDGRTGVWTEEQMQKGRDALYKKYPDAQVVSLTEHNAAQGIDDDAMYVVDTGDGRTSTWDSSQMRQGYDALLSKYPQAKVMRAKNDTYWQDKAAEQTDALNKFDADNKEFFRQHEKDTALYNTGEASRIDFDEEGYLERDKQYKDLQAKRQQMEIERANNPYIKAMYEAQSRKSDEDIARYDKQIAAIKSSDNKDKGDLRNLRQARKLARDTKDVYDVDVADSNDGFADYVRNMGQGAGDVFSDADFWTRGLTTIARNINIHGIEKRLNKDGRSLYDLTEEEIDKELTPSEKDLFLEFIRNASAQAERAGNMARGYTAGQTAAESIGYMTEFIATAGVAKGIGSALSAAESGLGKWIARELTGKTAQAITNTAGKAAYNVVARPAEKAIFHTALHPTTYSSIAEALTQIDDNGQLVDAGNAIASTVLDQIIENWSESIGEPLEKILPTSLLAKGVTSKSGQRVLSKIGKADWAKMWVDSDVHKVLMDAGFNGLVGEMAEEWAGNAVRLSVGLMDKDDFAKFASWDEQVDMMASFAPMTLFGLGSQSVAVHRIAKERNANLALVRDALTRQGWTEQEISNVLDNAHTKDEIKEILRPVVNNIVSQRTNGGAVTTDYMAMLDFARINEMDEILDEARKYEREQSRAVMRQTIEMELGATEANPDSGKFTHMMPSVNDDGTTSEQEMVTTVTDEDGNLWYLIGRDNAKVMLRKKGDTSGQPFFVTDEEYAERLTDGSYKEYTTTVDEYLDSEVEAQRKAQETRRINDAVTAQYDALNKRLMQDPTINLGTDESPKTGIIQAVRRDGVIVSFETPTDLGAGAKLIHKISLDEAMNAIGESSVADTRTDDQIARDEADREYVQEQRLKQINRKYNNASVTVNGDQLTIERVADMPYNTEDGTEVVKVAARNASGEINDIVVPVADIQVNDELNEENNTDVTVDTNLDFRGNPLPMKTADDGTTLVVDDRELWRRDPEAYLRWNDAQRNGVTTNSMKFLSANIDSLQRQRAEIEKKQAANLDPPSWQAYEDEKVAMDNKINTLTALYNRYLQEQQYSETVTQINQQMGQLTQRLLETKTPEQTAEINAKIDDLRRQYYEVSAQSAQGQALANRKVQIMEWTKDYADMPVKPVDMGNVIDIITADNATPAQIAQLQDMVNYIFSERLKGKNYVINGLHLNGVCYLFAEGCINEETTKRTYFHERQHEINERTPDNIQQVIESFGGNRDMMEVAVGLLSDTDVYAGKSASELADEILSFSLEKQYIGKDMAGELHSLGFPAEYINFVTTLYGEQTKDGYRIPKRQDNGAPSVGNYSVTGRELDGATEETAAGDGRYGAAENGSEADRERIRGEVESLFADTLGPVFDADGEVVAIHNDGETPKFSIRTWDESGRDALVAYLTKQVDSGEVTKEEADNLIAEMDRLTSMAKELDESGVSPLFSQWSYEVVRKKDGTEVPVLHALKKNSEYELNIDFSTVCKKRRVIDYLFNRMIREGDLIHEKLSPADIARMNQIIQKHGLEIACGICFVDSKRYNAYRFAEGFLDKFNPLVSSLMPGVDVAGFNYSNNVAFNNDGKPDLTKVSEIVDWSKVFTFEGDNPAALDEYQLNWKAIYRVLKPLYDKARAAMSKPGFEEKFQKRWYNDHAGRIKDDLIAEAKADGKKLAKKDISVEQINERLPEPTNQDRLDFAASLAFANKNSEQRMALEISQNPNVRKLAKAEDFIASEGWTNILQSNEALETLWNVQKGAAGARPNEDNTQYKSEVLAKGVNGDIYDIAGYRMQSFSDFIGHMYFDYMQAFADLAAMGLPGHAYTKEPAFVKLFGLMGMKVNMSLVSDVDIRVVNELGKDYAGLTYGPNGELTYNFYVTVRDADGNIVRQGQTFPPDEAFALQDDELYTKNVGTIAVGLSRQHILKMLRDPRIRMVIPYHSSGLPHGVALVYNLNEINDYTKVQSTRGKNGAALSDEEKKIAYARVDHYNFILHQLSIAEDKTAAYNAMRILFVQTDASKVKIHERYEELYNAIVNGGITTGLVDRQLSDRYDSTDFIPKVAADIYIEACDRWGYEPKFFEFANEQAYYKVLIDFAVYDKDGNYTPQEAIKFRVPDNVVELISEALAEDEAINDAKMRETDPIIKEWKNYLANRKLRKEQDRIAEKDDDKITEEELSLMRTNIYNVGDPRNVPAIEEAPTTDIDETPEMKKSVMEGQPMLRATEVAGNPSLIAVHNLAENDLLDAFDLGGFPMPSIAITKTDIGHTDFGDISLVFGKETINPKNRKNKVYSGDAWTPTFPTINYKLNEDKASDIATRAQKVGDLPLFNPSQFNSVNYEGRIEDSDARSLIEEFKNDYNAKQFYLAEQGNPVREFEMHEVEKYTEENVRRIKELLDKIGLENLKGVDRNLSPEILQVVKGFLNAVGDIDDSHIKRIARNYVVHAIDYATNGNRTTEIDYDATHRKIDERIDQSAFEKWLEDLFSGIVEKRGIRNEVDMFTPIGNRRAWEKLYDEVTLDNVVKAMSKKPARGGSGFFGGNIFGASFKTYNSIADIREDAARRMAVVDSEELQKQKDDILNRLSNVKVTEKGLGVGEMFDLTTNIRDAVAKSHTADGIYRYLKDYYPDITMDAAQEIADIVKDIQSISTKYFEAKPYRAVGFDEVKLAVVPQDVSQAIVDGLQERGVPVRTYEKDNQQERMDIISNATEEMGLRFRTVEITPEVREEMDSIIADAKANGTYLKAPNGADTNLNPEQWAMVRTKKFKDWFGLWDNDPENASKVVDENGEPMVVYHGTNKQVNEFNIDSIKVNNTVGDPDGFYFTNDFGQAGNYSRASVKKTGEGKFNVHAAFLNLRNPVDATEAWRKNKKKSLDKRKTYGEVKRSVYNTFDAEVNDGYMITSNNNAWEYVAISPNQIKSATVNTGSFNPTDPDIRYRVTPAQDAEDMSAVEAGDMEKAEMMFRDVRENNDVRFRVVNNNQQVFISNALASLDKIPMKSGNAQAWINKIQQAGGLKKEEDKWIGLTDWLKEQAGNISKEDVSEYIREHQVQIEEVHYAGGTEDIAENTYAMVERILQEKFSNYIAEYYEQNNGENDDLYGGDSYEYALDKLRKEMNDESPYAIERSHSDVYLTFPYEETDDLQKWADKLGIDFAPQNPINSTRLDYTTDGLIDKREIALVVPTIASYNESDEIHFGDAGEGRAIAWARFGEAVDEDGNRILVIDEIQSKRHQDGGEKGYRSQFNKNELDAAREASRDYGTVLFEKYIKGQHPGEDFLDYATAEEKQKFNELSERVSELVRMKYNSVPDAPFRDSWDALAMKRMLRLAAEEGYNKIAWTSGQMQSDRYSLTKRLENFYYKPNADGTYKVSANLNQRRHGYTDYSELNYDSLTIDRISEIFGKEIASKVSDGKGRKGYSHNNESEWTTFSGRDLKIINDGMRYFYDQKLVNWMNKYGKKWGVQVIDMTLPDLENREGWHSVAVTPEMKESVMQGQMMFSVGSIAQQPEKENESLINEPVNDTGEEYTVSASTPISYRDIQQRLINDGLAEVGEEEVSDLMMDVFSNSDESVRNDIIKVAPRFDYSLSKATGEYFSTLALKDALNDSEMAAINKMRDVMRDAIGTDNLSAADALWIMYRTMGNPTANDIFAIARDTEVASRLGHSAQGIQARRQAEDAVRMSVTEAMHSQSAAEMYNQSVAYWRNRLKEGYVDMYESVNDLMSSMEKATGHKAEEYEDIRIALNQQSSKALDRMKRYTADYLEPLWEAIGKAIQTSRYDMDGVIRYVELKHALERNDKFAKRDAIAFYQEEHDKLVKPLKDELNELKKGMKKAVENGDADEELRIGERIDIIDEQITDHDNSLSRHIRRVENGTSAKYRELRENDYAGLTGLYSEYPGLLPRNKYKTDEEYNKAARKVRRPKYDTLQEMENEAQHEIDIFEAAAQKEQVDNLWDRINAATKETLRSQYASGIISRAQYNSVKDMFEYYVPLRGFKDDVAEDIWSYYTSAPSGSFSAPVITAKGRQSEAENPFLWIGTMASSAIAQNMKNESKLALYYYAMNNPQQDLVKVQDMWYEIDVAETASSGRKVFVASYPPLTAGMTPEDAVNVYNAWEESMRQKASVGQAYTRHGNFSTNGEVAFIDNKKKAEHFIRVKANGRDMIMYVNGSPRAAQAINGLLNVENTTDYKKVFGGLLRLMSSLNTSWNPEFWISNMQRDLLFATMSMDIKGDGAKDFRQNLVTPARMMRLSKAYADGTLNELKGKDAKYAQYFKEFAEGGAITGYTVVKSNEVWEKEIDSWMKSNGVNYDNKGKDPLRGVKSVVKSFFGKFSDLGEAVEQMTRFSAFVTARKAGKSIADSVNDAKEISVNFNRKGSGKAIEWKELDQLIKADGTRLNNAEKAVVYAASLIPAYGRRTIMFFNAAIQGLNAMYKLWEADKRKTAKWMAGYFTMGVLQAVIHSMLDDDDEYLNIPEYTRRANAMIGAGGIYFKWALPQESRFFYAAGDILVQRALGNEKERGVLPNIAQGAFEIINQALDLSPINPAGGVTDILPSVAQPLVENYINKDFTGANVYYENKYLSEDERARTPKFSNTKRGTSGWAINAAKLLNYISGGDSEDAGWWNWHPESIQNFVEGLGGGTFTTIGKLGDTVNGLAGTGDLTVRRTLFINRILELESERSMQYHTNELYRFYKGEAEHTKTKLKKYKKMGAIDDQVDLMGSDDYEIYLIFERYRKMLEPYEEQLKIEESSEEKRILNREMDALKREMIHEISNL